MHPFLGPSARRDQVGTVAYAGVACHRDLEDRDTAAAVCVAAAYHLGQEDHAACGEEAPQEPLVDPDAAYAVEACHQDRMAASPDLASQVLASRARWGFEMDH